MKYPNNEGITFPESVAHLTDQPLCRIVAAWGLAEKHYLNRMRIMQAFSVSRRKAGYILRYIVHSPCITCEQRIYTDPRTHRQELRVQIRTVEKPQMSRPAPAKMRGEDRESIWAQLLQRPWSELQL